MINSSNVATAVALCAGLLSCAMAVAATPAPVEHFGMCDASAAVAVGADHFLVANDEDDILRLYRLDGAGGEPKTFDLTTFLKLAGDKKQREADIEGAAQINNRVYWIASHGANTDGKSRPDRRQLFATDLDTRNGEVGVTPAGKPYNGLLEAMDKDPLLTQYGLPRAAEFAPGSDQGLNIEGLAATPEGYLLIGFRNPVPGGKALLIKLQNPDEVLGLAGTRKAVPAAPRFAAPIELPLGGLGIRSIGYAKNLRAYLIVAGPHGKGGPFKLYKWAEGAAPTPLRIDIAPGFRPEALFGLADGKTYQLLSDDGDERVGNQDCKELASEPKKQKFRSLTIVP